MALELLKKEEEFHKLNAELESRSKMLMQEINSVMKIQDCMAQNVQQNCPKDKTRSKVNASASKLQSQVDKWDDFEDDNKQTIKSLSNIFQSKLTLLQDELEDIKNKYKNKCSELKHLQTDYTKLEEELNKVQHSSQLLREQKEKTTKQLSAANTKLQNKESEIISLRKENEMLRKELKTLSANSANYELRINKVLEETEKLKANLKIAKQEEKELRDNHKKEVDDLTYANKRLEKQTAELSNGFKKQFMLIDNLKKQKMYLESSKLIQMTEDEFSRILDWKPSQ